MVTNNQIAAGAIATFVGFNFISSCRDKKHEEVAVWENAHGTKGFINLNDVRDAFRKNQSMAEFETRVNEIFEGDNLIVFEAKEIQNGFKLLAREDLDGSKSTTDKDDLLFTLQVKNRTATLIGAGVNEYYKESWIYEVPSNAQQQMSQTQHRSSFVSSPFFWWWVLSPGWGGYYTPMGRYDAIYSHRTVYRSGIGYRSQVGRNGRFESSMSTKYGSRFRQSVDRTSSQRKSYVRSAKKSPGFKSKLAASKSKTGSSTRSQMRSGSSAKKARSFSSTSRSSGSKSYGGFRSSSGF